MAVWVVPFFLPFWSEVAQSCVTLYNPMDYIAYQAPPSMEFSRQEYCSGLPFPSPGDLPDPRIKPRSPTLQADALPSEPQIGYPWKKKPLHSRTSERSIHVCAWLEQRGGRGVREVVVEPAVAEVVMAEKVEVGSLGTRGGGGWRQWVDEWL